ncbi:fibronectin type III domain-containing protein 1 [Aplochiton taeniatus]
MAYTATRTFLALFVTFFASTPGLTAEKPLRPRNVKLAAVDKGLRVSWEPPNELDGRPVEHYNIGYGTSMRGLRFLKVDKDRRSEVLEDLEPGVLHFLKMSAENKEGMSKPVYKAETPGGPEIVRLDGFAVMGKAPVNTSSLDNMVSMGPSLTSLTNRCKFRLTLQDRVTFTGIWNFPSHPADASTLDPPAKTGADGMARPSGMSSSRVQRRPPQSSSGPRQPERTDTAASLLERRSHHSTQPQSDQRNGHSHKLASESVYVVSLQAQRALGRSAPVSRATVSRKTEPEPEEYEATDISVRVMSPKSVLISWVDPAVEMEKVSPGGSRHYEVRYREKGESARWEYKVIAQRRLMIDSLSADGMYEFSVRISQGDNHGKWSASVFQRTPESAPSGPPENFMVKPLRGKGTAVTATWEPPEEPNGRIREYILSYAPAIQPFGMKSVTYRGSTTSTTIDGLQPGERYIFKIRATNRKGQGPQSKAFTVVMPGTSSAASFSKKQNTASHTPSTNSQQDSGNIQSEVTKEKTIPTRAPPAMPTNRLTRPLSQTRSYHSIFSSIRGSALNRGRDRGKEKEEEHTTTPAIDVEEQTTLVPTTPKAETPSPTRATSPDPPKAPPRRPIKESAATRKHHTAATYPEGKPSIALAKPSTPAPRLSASQTQTEDPFLGLGARGHPSVAGRVPLLANRHQGRLGPGSRLSTRHDGRVPWGRATSSSSVGAGRPVLRETPTRSRASGATGPSHGGHRDSGQASHRGFSDNKNNNHHSEDYLNEDEKEAQERNNKVPDPTSAPKVPTSAMSDNLRGFENEDGESVDTRESPTRTRTGSFPAIPPSHRRPVVGTNGRPLLTSDRAVSSGANGEASIQPSGGISGGASQSPSSSSSSSLSKDRTGGQGTRTRYPNMRGKFTNGGALKPGYGNGKNGRPNLTATSDKESTSPTDNDKANGRRYITGPDGTQWVLDLDRGVLMNEAGRVLQDSQGQPRRVVLGEDGRTIFDHLGSPLVNQEGMALFGHGRDSRPVVNPKDKVLTVGGKPVVGLDRPQPRTTTTAPTTTLPTTTEWTTEDTTTPEPYPTCPPGTFSRTDDRGYPILDPDGILDCYPEDAFWVQTTLVPTTTTPEAPTPEPDTRPFNNSPSSEFDLSGKKRFTAPYVNFIQKDVGAPCSLTEALEYLQVDVLENLMEKDNLATNQKQPPKNKPHNITVVAMEGCHSFVILDWARPLSDDMVSGYMVYSASYDDVLNNRWSPRDSSGTHLAVENLKPNSRYYFKVQAKNNFGMGPVSDTLTYVTESDDPLLIERPPGGEPIWIPFSFKYNSAHSSCKGSQYVKRTWYKKFVGVVLCNSLRYKIFMGDGLRDTFYSLADTFGQGEDHCQFVDSYLDGRTGPPYLSNNLPTAQGYHRSYRQEPVTYGPIGRHTPHPFVGWYECGVPIPGKW